MATSTRPRDPGPDHDGRKGRREGDPEGDPVRDPEGDPEGRRPVVSVLLVALTIALGLATRRLTFLAFLGKYPGDGLWALMVFLLVGLVRSRATTRRVSLIALGISYAIEVSQLYEPPWLVAVRSTTLGHLVLGSKFHLTDLLAYTIGIAVGAGMEHFMRRRRAAE